MVQADLGRGNACAGVQGVRMPSNGLFCCSGAEDGGPIGADVDKFVNMIDTARTFPDQSAMIPGRLKASEKGSWQFEIQRAVFERQTFFACGLDGKHGSDDLTASYCEEHFCMMRNQRTFGGALQDNSPFRGNLWVGKGGGGALANLYYLGAPVTMFFLSPS